MHRGPTHIWSFRVTNNNGWNEKALLWWLVVLKLEVELAFNWIVIYWILCVCAMEWNGLEKSCQSVFSHLKLTFLHIAFWKIVIIANKGVRSNFDWIELPTSCVPSAWNNFRGVFPDYSKAKAVGVAQETMVRNVKGKKYKFRMSC
jgi:hypothetical protein